MRLQDLDVDDLMTGSVITITPDDTFARAAHLMSEADVRHLPVVDGERHLIGIVSHRDVLAALESGRRSAPVGRRGLRRVVAIDRRRAASEAAARMLEHKIGALPVVDDVGRLVGIITQTDLLRVAHQALRHGPEWQHEWR